MSVPVVAPAGGADPCARIRALPRVWLLAASASSLCACEAGDLSQREPPKARPAASATPPAPAAAPAAARGPEKEPGLEIVRLGSLSEEDKGGQLVVLLHGWRAQGDDLVPLARELSAPRTRFLVPAAPLPEPGGGRAWWRLDTNARPAHAWTDELPADHQPSPQVAAARRAVQQLLRDARQRYAPDSVALAGFSQGAMLALDVALAADPPVDRVAVLSGVLLADSLAALRARRPRPPAVFVSHGRADPVLPFRGGESIASVLSPYGHAVTFVPFEGGHAIPPAVVEQLRSFLAAGARQ